MFAEPECNGKTPSSEVWRGVSAMKKFRCRSFEKVSVSANTSIGRSAVDHEFAYVGQTGR